MKVTSTVYSHVVPEERRALETSLAVQWLRLHASTARGTGSIPGRGTKIPHAMQCSQQLKKKKKKKGL